MKPEVKVAKRKRRHLRVRKKVVGTEHRPRLVVYRSHRHIYAQIAVDPPVGPSRVITGASTLSPEIREKVASADSKVSRARLVGELIARRALEKGIRKVVFDRAGYKYHGRVRALAEAAREAGLEF